MTYGPARIGFGLFVPEFRKAFDMSTTTIGLVSSLGFLGFLAGLLIAQALLERNGPEVPVLSGLAAAILGMGLVALSPGLPVLACGVVLAASSAGLAWTPFNDAVHRAISAGARPAALSRISTGTAVGITLAGGVALGTVWLELGWRACWAGFALLGVLAFGINRVALRAVGKAPRHGHATAGQLLWRPEIRPLMVIGFVFGTISAIYISFAADRFASGGVPGLPAEAVPAAVFIFFGLFGLAGILAGRVEAAIGLPWLLRLVILTGAASAVLVALLPGSWIGLAVSAGLQGLHVMMTSAVLAFWSERLFPALPSAAFTAALLATAAGNALGPAVAGLAASGFGTAAMFLGAAALPVATALLLRARHAQGYGAPAPA
ncbi:MAG: MFS transporter [Paracoccaceae bacterium]